MKQWLRTLLQLSKWTTDYPSAPELARELNRWPSAVYRDLEMMEACGYVKRVRAKGKNPDALEYFSPEYSGAKGLQSRWQLVERGRNRLRRDGLLSQ